MSRKNSMEQRRGRVLSALVAALLGVAPVAAQAPAAGGSEGRPGATAMRPASVSGAAAGVRRTEGPAATHLRDVYALAHERSPRLAAANALARATAAQAASASLPPDPTLQLGVMNFTLPGLSATMPTSMAPSIQAMQRVPFPGKLGLSGRIAEQTTAISRAQADEAWWGVRSSAAAGFYALYRVDRQLEVMLRTLGLLQDYQQVAQAMYGAGEGHQADVLRAGVEVARMQADIAQMEAMRRVAAAKLNAVLDRAAETPIPSPVLDPLPDTIPPPDTLAAWAESTRPALSAARTGVERAGTRLDLARRELWPDLTVGFQYGQRAGDMGTERMGSAMVGFSLPIFAGRRQLRAREAAAAMESMAEADLAETRADVAARIGELQAELERARTLVALYRTEVLPQAAATVESSLSAYRVGHVDFMTLVDAQMTENRYEQDYYGLLADYGVAVAALETTLGRELPAAGNLLAEAR